MKKASSELESLRQKLMESIYSKPPVTYGLGRLVLESTRKIYDPNGDEVTTWIGTYILNEAHVPVPVSTRQWAGWFENAANRIVQQDTIKGVRVSTVFLGLDHSFAGGPPLLFETMIFGGELDGSQERCSSWDEALEMHGRAMVAVKTSLGI